MRDCGDREVISFKGGTIEVKRSKGALVMEIKHPYRFGETVRLSREQAAELASELLREAEK